MDDVRPLHPMDPLPGDQVLLQQVRDQQAGLADSPTTTPTRPPTASEVLADILDALNVPRDTPWDAIPQLVRLRCRVIGRAQLQALVQGSLACAIDAHGPIDHVGQGCAAKRIAGAVHAVLMALHDGRDTHA